MKVPEDLSVRARRGELDDGEEQRLRQLLLGSAEADIAHRAGLAFDRADQILAGDDALAARVAERLLSEGRPAQRRRLPVRALLLAAALLATGAATAAVGSGVVRSVQSAMERVLHVERDHTREPVAPRLARGVAKPAEVASAPAVSSSPETPSAPESPGVLEPTAPSASASRVAASPLAAPVSVAPAVEAAVRDRAAALYVEANRARHTGDVQAATALYEAVQREFPGSPESAAADIPLGVIYTRAGSVDAAVRHFRRYLTRAPAGDLAQEALWGLSQAYASAGRGAEAREVCSELLSRYPDSAYASAARSRLEAGRK